LAEIQDSEFLRILRESPVVSPEQVRSAQEAQRDELDRQGSCRSLFAILCEKGLIDERVARSLNPISDGGRPGDVTPHTPTVVLPPPDETPSDVRRPASNSSIASIRSARKRPASVDAAAADPRNILGPYIMVSEVGRGGMGRVYRAWDENVGRWVALKVIDTEDLADRERFVREAQIAGRLSHPSIATVFHAGEEDRLGYIAMQFIDGWPIDAQPLPLLSALALIRDAAQALSYAHEQGVVHRDVKPGNLMVDGQGHVYLTDFGLAKEVVAESAGAQLSITGTTFGTPQYMSPEQARGEHKKIDGRSDVYSLGATLYALLAHRPPFISKNLATLLLEVLDKTPPRVSRFNREISPELEMLVERAMAKEPGKRFPSMAAFTVALDRMIRDGHYAGRYGMAKAVARRWVPRIAVAAAIAAALWFGLPYLKATPKVAPPYDPVPELYANAVTELTTLEGQPLKADVIRKRVETGVLAPLAEVLRLKPADPRARGAKVRALYASGDRDGAARELASLEALKESDYRLALVAALLALEKALEAPCPMPVTEAPAFEWDRPPQRIAAGIGAVSAAKVTPDLADEYAKDKDVIKGLEALAAGDYDLAADKLEKKLLPVFQSARIRAAYLARKFDAVKKVTGRREGFGARLALAAGSAAELQVLLADPDADKALVHTALARLEGIEAHVEPGLVGAPPERQAALRSVRLRAQSARWEDGEKEYRAAMELAGESPATWSGKLAAIELRLGLGSRLQRSRADGKALLEEAAKRADALASTAPDWVPPRLLAAQARLKLGRLDEARADVGKAGSGVRARLLASAIELAAAEREMRAGRPYVKLVEASQSAARDVPRSHPEALTLLGMGSLFLALQAISDNQNEAEHVSASMEALTAAIQAGSIEARYQRAQAQFLLAEIRRREGGTGKAEGESALADATAVLAAAPEFHFARLLRGNVNFSLGRDAEAVADWRALIEADRAWDTPSLRSDIQRALDRQKK
jgi:hypothetical protein